MKKKCPIDADMTVLPNMCLVLNKLSLLHCTRKRGHEGKHHAHGMNGECYEIWDKSGDEI